MNRQNFFQVFFEKFLFQCWRSVSSSMLQYFITTAFLSRKRMQNYCFTTYLPNLSTLFFQTFCKLFANSLICRCVLRQGFSAAFQGRFILHLNFITRTRIRIFILTCFTNPSPCSPLYGMDGFFIYIRTSATITATLQRKHIIQGINGLWRQIICNGQWSSATPP